MSTGERSARIAPALMFLSLPSRGSSVCTTSSRSPRNAFHRQPDAPPVFAEDDDGQFLRRRRRRVEFEHLVRRDQPDRLPVQREMLPALERFDPVARHLERAGDARQRQGVGFAADLHEQRAHDRERQRQLQRATRAAPGLGRQPHAAAHLAHHGTHHVQPHAPAGKLRHPVTRGEPGQEEKFEQFLLAHPGGGVSGGQPLAHNGSAQVFQVDAAPVVGEGRR